MGISPNTYEKYTFKIAVFTLAKSNFRYAFVYRTEDTQAFIDAHVRFFKIIQGVPKTMVYDNMKVAVAKFVGKNEKEATEALKQMSLYYGFQFRFCNVRRGNEKGHVENAVEFLRRKVFASKYRFEDFANVQPYLENKLDRINRKSSTKELLESPYKILQKEQESFIPLLPDYDTSVTKELRVDKLSTIAFKTNRYSVPDHLVGKYVTVKIYIHKIKVYHGGICVCEHPRIYTKHQWNLEIKHYRKTLLKKPGAIKNSLVLSQTNTKLQELFHKFFTSSPREFIEIIDLTSSYGINKIVQVVDSLEMKRIPVNLDNIKIILIKNPDDDSLKTSNSSYRGSIEEESSKHLLAYAQLLNGFSKKEEVV